MSLIRAACRLQAIEALNSDPVIDGMVRGRVYDSRISAFDHRDPVPTILVTTEETKGEAWSHQNGGAPFGLVCDLVLEIAMNSVATMQINGMADPVEAIGYAATDAELEADLDLLEERAVEILTRGETAAAQLLRSAVVKRVPHVASSRFATDQTGEKFAVHLVTLRIELFTPEDENPFAVPSGPYALLPEPLRTIAAASDPDGLPRSICDRLIARLAPLPAPSEPAPFSGADMILAPQVLDADDAPDRAADIAAGRTIAIAANTPQ